MIPKRRYEKYAGYFKTLHVQINCASPRMTGNAR